MPKLVRDRANTEFVNRLRVVVESADSVSWLAREIQRSEGAIRKWLTGESEPNATDIRLICEKTKTSVEWLVSGAGTKSASAVAEALASYSASPNYFSKEYIFDVLSAVNGVMYKGSRVMTAERHANFVVALLPMLKNKGKIDVAEVEALVKSFEG